VEVGLDAEGSFVAINTRIAQSVPHLHVHIVPRWKKDGLFSTKNYIWQRRPYKDEDEIIKVQTSIRSTIAELQKNISESESMGVISGVIIGAIGSILAVIVIELFLRSRPALFLFGSSYRLAIRLRREGIIAFQFTREDYRERLPTFLSYADHSIAIVSISLRLTSDEGELLQLFKNRIAERSDFRIAISLISPKSPAAALAAASLNVTGDY
jgi:hypothetical protein